MAKTFKQDICTRHNFSRFSFCLVSEDAKNVLNFLNRPKVKEKVMEMPNLDDFESNYKNPTSSCFMKMHKHNKDYGISVFCSLDQIELLWVRLETEE